MLKAKAGLALGLFAGGFALGVAVMIAIEPGLIETEWLHLVRLSIVWVGGCALSFAVFWSFPDDHDPRDPRRR